MTKSIEHMTPREFEAFCRAHGASRQQAKAMTAGFVQSGSEAPEANPLDGPAASAAIAELLALVSKEKK
jgi:hypothetical protein